MVEPRLTVYCKSRVEGSDPAQPAPMAENSSPAAASTPMTTVCSFFMASLYRHGAVGRMRLKALRRLPAAVQQDFAVDQR